MSLKDCVSKAGKALNGGDLDAIQALVADGLTEDQAVAARLSEIDAEIEGIASKVEEAGGVVARSGDAEKTAAYLKRKKRREQKTKKHIDHIKESAEAGKQAMLRNSSGSLFYTVTPSVNTDKAFQVTVWDSKGPLSDSKHDAAEEIIDYYSGEIKGIGSNQDFESLIQGREVEPLAEDADDAFDGDDLFFQSSGKPPALPASRIDIYRYLNPFKYTDETKVDLINKFVSAVDYSDELIIPENKKYVLGLKSKTESGIQNVWDAKGNAHIIHSGGAVARDTEIKEGDDLSESDGFTLNALSRVARDIKNTDPAYVETQRKEAIRRKEISRRQERLKSVPKMPSDFDQALQELADWAENFQEFEAALTPDMFDLSDRNLTRMGRAVMALEPEHYETAGSGDVTIYRAMPSGSEIEAGDWVSFDEGYAAGHESNVDDGNAVTDSIEVSGSEVFWYGADEHEWVYIPEGTWAVDSLEELWKNIGSGKPMSYPNVEGDVLYQSAAQGSAKTITESDAANIKTGDHVKFNFSHNTESATKIFGKPKKDSQFGRYHEPSGRYVSIVSDDYTPHSESIITGVIEFQNPLVVDNNGLKWKEDLSKKYGGKRGKNLSKAVIADGYDGIITTEGDKYISEIVDFTTFDEAKALYQSTQEKNLFVAHNLSAENLLAANELGGLASPSLAVARSDISDFEGFGEITLLADPSILESEKARTFDADVYSPRQPRASYVINRDKFGELSESLADDIALLNDRDLEAQSLEETNGPDNFMRSVALQYNWLKSQGKAPKPKNKKVDPVIKKMNKLGLDHWDMIESSKFIKLATDYYKDLVKQIEAADSTRGERYENLYFDSDGNVKENLLRELAGKVVSYRESKIDTSQLRYDISAKFRNKKLNKEYEDYAKQKFNELVEGKKLFKGFTNSGNRKYVPYTMENILKEMTSKLQGGEVSFYGAPSVRAAYANEMKTIEAVQKRRDQIIPEDDLAVIKEDANSIFENALEDLKPFYKFESDSWGYSQDAGSAIMEGSRGVREAFDLTPESRKIIDDLVEYLSALPSTYFESKIQRRVDFSEFDTAIVPNGASKEAIEILKNSGVKIRRYNPNVEGSRKEAIAKQQKLLFQTENKPRGQFNTSTNEITLTKNADLSTFLHETGHYYLEVMRDLASKSPEIQADLDLLGAWWADNNLTDRVAKHEAFASGFETYLLEGKAPTKELQPVFTRFSHWLTFVYKKLIKNTPFGANSLKIELSDEVRGVFDRMVASQEAIEKARAEQSYGPMKVEQLGVSPADAEEYQRKLEESNAQDEANLIAEVMREISRETEKWWKQGVSEQRSIVKAEVDALPEYMARDFLSGEVPEGMTPMKLNSDYISKRFGKKPGKKLNKMSSKDGVHPDRIAPMFGFKTGNELVNALLGTRNKKDRAAAEVAEAQARMKQLHGDMLQDGSIQQEAEQIVHSEKRADLLISELKFLNRHTKKQDTPRQYFKSAAEELIGETPIELVRPDIHRRNEIKAREAALRAAAEGGYDRAALEQHRAVRQFYLYREAMKAKENAEKYRKRLDKIARRKYRTKEVDGDYIQQVKVLVAAYDMRKSKKSVDLLNRVNAFIAAQEASNPDLVAGGALASIKNWHKMTINDLRSLLDVAENLLTIGKNNSEAEKKARDDHAETMISSLLSNLKTVKKDTHSTSWIIEKARWVKQFGADHVKLENFLQQLDGWVDNGIFQTTIFKPLWNAQMAEVVRGEAEHKELADLFEGFNYMFSGLRHSARDVGLDKYVDTYDMPVGQYSQTISLTRGERIVLALNWGNEGNKEAMRTQTGRAMSDAEIKKAIETLTDAELELVNNIWAYVDKFYPEVSKIEQKATGIAPAKVEASPFEVNGVQMRGGYYPLLGDPNTSWKAEEDSIEDRKDKMVMGGAGRATTKHGSTIERVGFAGRDVSLSIDGLFKHVDGVVHDITHRQAVIEVDNVYKRSDIREAVTTAIGKEGYNSIKNAIMRVAAGPVHPTDLAALNKFFRFSRMATSFGAMGYSFRTAIINMTGVFPAIPEVGAQRLATEVMKEMASPMETMRFVTGKSDFMANRAKTMHRDVFEVLGNMKGNSNWNAFKSNAFLMIQKIDAFVTRAVWRASYNKSIESGVAEDQAIFDADRTVVRTQSSGMKIDLAAIEDTSEMVKAMSPMYTYFNAVYNLIRRQKGKAGVDMNRSLIMQLGSKDVNKWKLFESMVWIVLAPAIVEEIVFGPSDDEEESEEMAGRYAKSVASYYAGQWFGVRELSSFIKYGQSFETPMQSAITAVPMAVAELYEGLNDPDYEFDKGSVRAISDVLPVLGFPSGAQINRTWGYLIDVENSGEDVNPWKLLFTGRDKDSDLEKLIK